MYHRQGVGDVIVDASFSTGGGGGASPTVDPLSVPVPDCMAHGWACSPLVLWMQEHAPEGLRSSNIDTLMAGLKKGLVGMKYQGVSLENIKPGLVAVRDAVLYYLVDARLGPSGATTTIRSTLQARWQMQAAAIAAEVSKMAPAGPSYSVHKARVAFLPHQAPIEQGPTPPAPAEGSSHLGTYLLIGAIGLAAVGGYFAFVRKP